MYNLREATQVNGRSDSVAYDVVILGGGPAGITAGIYASRARLSTLLVEKSFPGGQLMMCENVENY
ncbi:MAG: FAD-dependent oxidoreductase, partial [Armatimonadota bacterium]